MADEYVSDRRAGISLGLEYKYRLLKLEGKKDYVIFDYTTGKVIEHIPPKETDFFTEQFAMERLHKMNDLERVLSKEVLESIDQIS
jgi:uncharacterized FlaG/YvyC family protein